MEAREGTGVGGVTVIGSEAPSNYQVSPRPENPNKPISGLQVVPGPAPTGLGSVGKKKRGRPRKYGPDGTVNMTFSPLPISASAPPGIEFSLSVSGKRGGRGRGMFEHKHHMNRAMKQSDNFGDTYSFDKLFIYLFDNEGCLKISELIVCPAGANFTPHIVTVNAGEDVTMKIISFSQQGPRATCILSASGSISNVTLRQPDSSGGTLTYEGRFEILSLTGSFAPTESGGTRGRAGGLSVSLSSSDGRVLGGGVAGLLIAASHVQVVVGSFLPSNLNDQKIKKVRNECTAAVPVPMPMPMPMPAFSAEKEDSMNGLDMNGYEARNPNPTSTSFAADKWAPMNDSRKSGTDINISLPIG